MAIRPGSLDLSVRSFNETQVVEQFPSSGRHLTFSLIAAKDATHWLRVRRFHQSPRIGPLPEIGIEFLELSSIKLGMKFREVGREVDEERSHVPGETTTSPGASNE